MALPEYLNILPDRNLIGAVLTAPVYFEVFDQNGLNISSLNVTINNINAITNGVFQSGYFGTITKKNLIPTHIAVIINHDDFEFSERVQVAATIEDQLGDIGRDYWEFITIPNPDFTAPIVYADPHGSTFDSTQVVILTASEPNVVIYYTLDNTKPNLSSNVYSTPLNISNEGSTVLRFIGVDNNNNSDIERTEIYVIDTVMPVVEASPVGGNYFSTISVSLICDDPTATIFYTTNNANPTVNSNIYTTPISVPENKITTLKFFAKDKVGNISQVFTEVYASEIAKNNYQVTNVHVISPFVPNMLEIRWDDMHPINTKTIGYNIYRSDVELVGKYEKLNSQILTQTYFQDYTLDTQIINEDVSEQFKRTVALNKNINDNFSLATLDATKWKESDIAELLFQFNGIIFSDKVGLKQESKITSTFKLTKDFDIAIDYSLPIWDVPHTAISSCIFRVKFDDQNFIQVSRDRSQTADVYTTNRFYNGNPDLPISIMTSDALGAFRITRTGSIIVTYLYNNNTSTWLQMNSYDAYKDDLYVELVGKSADVPIETKWNKFRLESGRAIKIEPLNQILEYNIQTSKCPIVDSTGTNKPTDKIEEVNVTIDGKKAYIKKVQGYEGIVTLLTDKVYDEVLKQWITPPIPNEHSTVIVSYKTKLHTTKLGLRKKYFYKVSLLTLEDETDLDLIDAVTITPEINSYIYQEAVRRNAWLLDQAGERVLLFLKKKAGEVCPCMTRDIKLRTHKRADQDCEICFGSGFIGGYDGPFPIIIANLTTEQRINQTERGLKLNYQIETWTGPTPLITQRDLIMRRNGDRCSVGPVTPTEGPGGVVLQQTFSMEVIDTTDVRYKLPVHPLPNKTQQPGLDKKGIKVPEIDSPKERENLRTEEKGINSGLGELNNIVKGRSINFSNINY
jgi:hypothetical protein